ncbi:DUF664 domain-containing protein [Streptomyces sp. ALI-76-A]|uniref:mycothiol transferase n=1 Tax=Streptomyces sp. ALI-76-A TaxID=3025736 RepID=UPI00256EBBCD|nr:DUF664 domain-containing protein [Streptomyces sp. ALI-76-A]MDL5199797.1 DUF664 domain-containing protein [Streptomyces sp. ALI-76-A]
MTPGLVLTEAYGRINKLVHDAAEGLDASALAFRISAATNSIAWLVWHLTRIQDNHVADILAAPEIWSDPTWKTRTGIERDVTDRGQGDGPAEVAAIQPPSPDGLLAYHDTVMTRTFGYLAELESAELDRLLDYSYTPAVSVGVRLVSVLSDNLQHAGQALFVRGIHERAQH